jgi:hypothetical protein
MAAISLHLVLHYQLPAISVSNMPSQTFICYCHAGGAADSGSRLLVIQYCYNHAAGPARTTAGDASVLSCTGMALGGVLALLLGGNCW